MDDVTGPAAEDRVELVLSGDGVADAAAVLQTVEAVPVIPAPRPLQHVAGNRRDVADLRRRDAFRRLREHAIPLPDDGMTADRIDRRCTADREAAALRGDLIEPLDPSQADNHVWRDQAILHHAEHVAAAAGHSDGLSRPVRLLHRGDGALHISRARVPERFHVRAPDRILSRVIGRSLMRRPSALNTALPTAATAGTLLDSPMLFAPYGP